MYVCRKPTGWLSGLLLLSYAVVAQQEKQLPELTVRATRPEQFMVGQKVQRLDSAQLAQQRFSTVAEFLAFQAPVAFKTYGAGQLTSLSIRGTAPSHTALLWNGININFPSVGQTDFSTIPLAGFDQMAIQYGSAASCVGTDAVGGSLLLQSVPTFRQAGTQTIVGLRAESSRNLNAQGGFRANRSFKNGSLLSTKTLFYGNLIHNDFGSRPQTNRRGLTYPQEPIRVQQQGLVQDVFWQLPQGQLLSVNTWLSGNFLTVQPQRPPLQEQTRTQAYRTQIAYQWRGTTLRGAFIRDITDYGRGEMPQFSHTEIDRFLLRAEQDFAWSVTCHKSTQLKIGAEAVRFLAKVDGYGGQLKTETRTDIYALLRHQFSEKWLASLNLRQAFVSRYHPPFTPSLGVEYIAYQTDKQKLTLPLSIARGYRVPTLNERFWIPQGNPDIRPERSFNKEIGAKWQAYFSSNYFLETTFTAFHNVIDNWTYWNPAKNYRVENLQKVRTMGLEGSWQIRQVQCRLPWQFALHYAYTDAAQQQEYGPYTADIVGKQLPYIPRHVVSSTWGITYRGFEVSLLQSVNSRRYITFDHSGQPLPPYYLANLLINKQLNHSKHRLNATLQVNNLTNTLYANLRQFAMPRRSVALGVVWGV